MNTSSPKNSRRGAERAEMSWGRGCFLVAKWMGNAVVVWLAVAASAAEVGEDPWGLSDTWFDPTQAVSEASIPSDDEWGFAGDAFGATGEVTPPEPEPEDYRAACQEKTQRFAALIATADNLVVADWRLQWRDAPPRDDDYETSDSAEIAQFNNLFRFAFHDGPGFEHMCAGHPKVTWRRGGKVVAQITIGHGESIRWEGFGFWIGDVPLTQEARSLLADWFQRRGFHIAEEWHLDEKACPATEENQGNNQ